MHKTRSCAHILRKEWVRGAMAGIGKVMGTKFFRDWKDLNDNWGKAVERNVDRKVEMNRASKQVDVGRLKRNVRVWGWQPEPSMGDSGRGRAPRARVPFDASNRKHMLDFARFVKYNSWREGCSYFLEDPYSDIPTMIRAKIADHTLSKLVEKV